MKRSTLLAIITTLFLLIPVSVLAAFDLPQNTAVIEASAFEGDLSITGVVQLPDSISHVQERAFASTRIYGLRIPAGCETVGADVLADTNAVYLYQEDASTQIDPEALDDVVFHFHPGTACDPAKGLIPISKLVEYDGLYYYYDGSYYYPLCPIDNTQISDPLIIPSGIDKRFVESLEYLVIPGLENITLYYPDTALNPTDISAIMYKPVYVFQLQLNHLEDLYTETEYTFSSQSGGGIGNITYQWTITSMADSTDVLSCATPTPSLTHTFSEPGDYRIRLTVTDDMTKSVNTSLIYTVVQKPVVYRALLVGNVYDGESSALLGPDNDVASLSVLLRNMPATPYSVVSYVDLTSDEMTAAIAETFADATENDVSLFYYSGHGTSDGNLCGTNNTYLHASALRDVLDTIPGTKIVLLDCCYSGYAIERSNTGFNDAVILAFSKTPKEILNKQGYIVLTASSQETTSSSLISGNYGFGVFTYGLCYSGGYDHWYQEWLSSMAGDANGDQAISVQEAIATVQERKAYLESLAGTLIQEVQYYGDTNFILWGK